MKNRNGFPWIILSIILLLLAIGSVFYFLRYSVSEESISVQSVMVLSEDDSQIVQNLVAASDNSNWDIRTEKPASAKPKEVKFIFSESKVFEKAELEAISEETVLAEKVVERINREYEKRGYGKAIAYISEQNDEEGVVVIQFIEPEKDFPESKVSEEDSKETKIIFSESKVFEESELEIIVKESRKDHEGSDLVKTVVDRINDEYEQMGYDDAVAHVYEQDDKEGVVRIELIEPEEKSSRETKVVFSESKVFEESELEKIVEESRKDHEGSDLVITVVERVNEKYKEKGYEDAVAYPTELEDKDGDGIIRIELIEPEEKSSRETKVVFSESKVFEESELEKIVEESRKDHEGSDLVSTVVERINEEYEKRGYQDSMAHVSEQEDKDGLTRIELVEPEEDDIVFSDSIVFEDSELEKIVRETRKDHKGTDLVDAVVIRINEEYEKRGYDNALAYSTDKKENGAYRIELVESVKETQEEFEVKKVIFSDSQIFEESELEDIVRESRKEYKGLDLLNDVVNRVNDKYEEKGYPNALAYIPEQRAKDGEFRIELVEGRLGSFTVEDNVFTFDAYYLRRFFFDRSKPLNLKDFEKQLIEFNKWSDGYAATATINPGQTAGTSDIVLHAKESYPNSVIGVFDNYGSEGTGKLRLGIHLVMQSLHKMRDTLQVGVTFNNAFYAPYADYSILTPSLRLRAGVKFSYGSSDVVSGAAKDYKIKGNNISQSAYFTLPVLQASALQLNLTGNATYLHSKSISMEEIVLSEATIFSYQVGTNYIYAPDNAYLYSYLNLSKAFPYFDGNSDFTRFEGGFNVNLGLFKQLITIVLKSQFQLVVDGEGEFPRVMYIQAGGATTVRGYAEACNEGKTGFIGNAELHLPVRTSMLTFDLFGFADYAFVVPEPDHEENSMWSWGIGADVSMGTVHVSAAFGWPQINLTQDPQATNGRLHVSLKIAPDTSEMYK